MQDNKKVMPTEVVTRTCGYFANVSNSNNGKREEIRQRKKYNTKRIKSDLDRELGAKSE